MSEMPEDNKPRSERGYDIDPETGFEVFYYFGQKRYVCSERWASGALCGFDTYELAQMRNHVRAPHDSGIRKTGQNPDPFAKPAASAYILNQSGKPYDRIADPDLEYATFKPEPRSGQK